MQYLAGGQGCIYEYVLSDALFWGSSLNSKLKCKICQSIHCKPELNQLIQDKLSSRYVICYVAEETRSHVRDSVCFYHQRQE